MAKKKTGLNTDFSISDAAKRLKSNRTKREKALKQINDLDDLNKEINRSNEPDSIRSIFED